MGRTGPGDPAVRIGPPGGRPGRKDAERLYAKRFPTYADTDLGAYRFYRFRPRRMKLFDERALGAGVFVTAAVRGGGRLAWVRTEIYREQA